MDTNLWLIYVKYFADKAVYVLRC